MVNVKRVTLLVCVAVAGIGMLSSAPAQASVVRDGAIGSVAHASCEAEGKRLDDAKRDEQAARERYDADRTSVNNIAYQRAMNETRARQHEYNQCIIGGIR